MQDVLDQLSSPPRQNSLKPIDRLYLFAVPTQTTFALFQSLHYGLQIEVAASALCFVPSLLKALHSTYLFLSLFR